MSTRLRGAARVTSVAKIGDVRLYNAVAKRRIGSAEEAGQRAELTIAHGGRVKGTVGKDGSFKIIAGAEVVLCPPAGKKDQPKPYLTVRVEFEVSYRLPAGFDASPEELAAFAQVNGVFNVWPYCREFIQSTTARMGLPAITLPLYRSSDTEQAKALAERASPQTASTTKH